MHEILNELLLKQQKGIGKGWEMDFRVAVAPLKFHKRNNRCGSRSEKEVYTFLILAGINKLQPPGRITKGNILNSKTGLLPGNYHAEISFSGPFESLVPSCPFKHLIFLIKKLDILGIIKVLKIHIARHLFTSKI